MNDSKQCTFQWSRNVKAINNTVQKQTTNNNVHFKYIM